MVKRIETFKRIREQMVVLGYSPFQNLPRWCQGVPVDSIYLGFIYITLILFLWTTSWFFFFEEKTFDELSESVYYTVQAALYIILQPIQQFTNDAILKIFDDLENIIEKSEYSIKRYQSILKKNTKHIWTGVIETCPENTFRILGFWFVVTIHLCCTFMDVRDYFIMSVWSL